MAKALTQTDLKLPGTTNVFHGKVRDVYTLDNGLLVMVATDRISAFDVILPKGIPFKGEILNRIAAANLDATEDIVPNWKIATPDPMVTIGHACEPYKLEVIVRAILTGSAWRAYKAGERNLCGVILPEGMKENQYFEHPILTPTTKADSGHDMNITPEEIVKQGLMTAEELKTISDIALRLFERGSELAKKKGLILVDTKYEFGKKDGKIYLIDEIHTPDSSRYFYADTYKELYEAGKPQRQLSKEFVRQWLIDHDFQGEKGQQVPEMTDAYCDSVSERYIELFNDIMDEPFERHETGDIEKRIETNVSDWIRQHGK